MSTLMNSAQTTYPLLPRVASTTGRMATTAAIAACWLMATAPAPAQFSENFDSYVPNSGMNGQGGWKGWDNDAAAANAAKVSGSFSFSPNNSVRISGTALTAGNYTDLVHTFAGANSGSWTMTARQWIPQNSTSGTSYFILLNTYNDGGPYSWSVETSFNLTSGMLVDDFGTGTLPFVRDSWAELKFVIDLDSNNLKAYYNNVQYANRAWFGSFSSGGVAALAAIDLYSDVSQNVYYDNILLVPEPGSATLLALFGLVGGIYRLRRVKTA